MWADEAGLDAAQRRIDEWESSIQARAERSRALSERLSGLTASAVSPDRTVEATVDSAGTLIDLRLDERIRTQSAARTAEQVLATTRAAYAELLRQVTEATRETLGPDDPAVSAVIDSYGRRLGARDAGDDGAGR
ncbi:YbaB/EbfC DNA-binding family protein [Micromonospora rhizosphaerae]|uniref:YbaB/EbfC DNA-binding family protein n=1 Tax=Micromonospora rhizosphaerae TaxID=568872 RepID=A0A1C6SMU8_9ACTN|nr:YbaB/EbfC family nucleoid-associated protein [Micromonospora rhizosphaerae]SCL30906.1 YbaB/EbfC DNA-binding family protein [Micromonospora rhizosphaerae]